MWATAVEGGGGEVLRRPHRDEERQMLADETTQRQFPRLRSQHTVLFEPLGPGAEEALARTTAVGLGGLSFVTEDELEIGSRLRIFIALRNEVIEAEAEVVYINAVGDPGREVGVSFVDVPDEHLDRIAALFEPEEETASLRVMKSTH